MNNPTAMNKPTAMNIPTVKFPVVCPRCRRETLGELPVATIAEALIQHAPITLRAGCHQVSWRANAIEVEQIREYLGASWLEDIRIAG
jgi:hypothetical protein